MASSREIKLKSPIKKIVAKIFDLIGYEIKRKNNFNDRFGNYIIELKNDQRKMINDFQRKCLASELNLWSIYQSLEYIKFQEIDGDIVECGVYNGNTLSFIGLISEKLNLKKNIWGYDTFDGFIKNSFSEKDTDFKTGDKVIYDESDIYYTLDDVKKNIIDNDPKNFEKYIFIKGDILETLNKEKNIPTKISFLRLDTDIYKTTKKQLEVMFDRLVSGGILHIDDYGICPGVKKAVDEFFYGKKIWLHRADMSCRYLIK